MEVRRDENILKRNRAIIPCRCFWNSDKLKIYFFPIINCHRGYLEPIK